MSDFSRRVELASEAGRRIDKAVAQRNGDGKFYRSQASWQKRVNKNMYSGELPLCPKPWLPCKLRITIIDLAAVGKKRMRPLCTGFICALLDSPQEMSKIDIEVSNGVKGGADR